MSLDATSYLLGKKSGGSGGTTNYSDLSNKPQINNTELSGNKSSSDLGLQDKLVSGTNIKTINNTSLLGEGDIQISGGGDVPFYSSNDKYFNIDLSTMGVGTYVQLNQSSLAYIRLKGLNGNTEDIDTGGVMYVTKKYSDAENDEFFAFIIQRNFQVKKLRKSTNSAGYGVYTSPTQFSSYTGNLPNDAITILQYDTTGYDNTKTQTLKNVNGTLTWVDD